MKNEIPSAEEFLLKFQSERPILNSMIMDKEDMDDFYNSAQGAMVTIELMQQFAKLHVEAALKSAAENATHIGCNCVRSTCSFEDCHDINKESIFNAYPLDNVK